MKTTAIVLALALGCAAGAQAADRQDYGSSSSNGTPHQMTTDVRVALHRLGNATRYAWHRLDASLHRMGHHDRTTAS